MNRPFVVRLVKVIGQYCHGSVKSSRFCTNFSTSSGTGNVTSNSTTKVSDLIYTSHFIQLSTHKLHLMNIKSENPTKSVCFLLHGAIENGEIFYSKKGQGLAPYLARQGHDVYIADLRGRGSSSPTVKEEGDSCNHGQREVIRDDIPRFIKFISLLSGVDKHTWIAHSWGGILQTSTQAYYPNMVANIHSQVYFGAKRRILTREWEYYTNFLFGFCFLTPFFHKYYGFYPGKELKIGSDNESTNSVLDTGKWARVDGKWGKWCDYNDNYDYSENYSKIPDESIPPTWHLAAISDKMLGNPLDVKLWAAETRQTHKYTILSKANGNKEDYDHVTMITGKHCDTDHFHEVSEWIYKHNNLKSI